MTSDKTLDVRALWDEEARVWVATSDDVPGLATEADTVDALVKNPTGGFIAGGTNLIDLMKRGVMAPTRLIDINNLPLKQIDLTPAGLNIGALAINSEVAENELVKKNFPLLFHFLFGIF